MPDVQEFITPQTNLVDTVAEQRAYAKNALVVRFLKDMMDPLRERLGVDLYGLRENNYNGQARENIDDHPLLSRFFQKGAKNRKYYEFQIKGPGRIRKEVKERNYVVVEEKISDDLEVIAVFDTNEKDKPYTYKPKIGKETREIPFIYLDHLYLVQPKTQETIDLADPWYQLPADTDDKFVKATQRRIGFMSKDAQITPSEFTEAFVRTNTVLLTDTQDAASWNMTEALGEEKTPVLNKWVAATLAGAHSTQKTRDLVRNKQGKVENLPGAIGSFIAGILRGKARFPQIFLPALIQFVQNKAVDPQIFQALAPYINDPRYSYDLQAQGLAGIIRLQRNAVAATLRFMDLLLGKGFKFPGLESREALLREIKSVLRYDDQLYESKLSEFGREGLSFASGVPKKSE